MAGAINLRDDYDGGALRAAARRTKTGRKRALAGACGDLRRGHAHRGGEARRRRAALGPSVQRAHGPDGLIDRKAPGQPPRLNDYFHCSRVVLMPGISARETWSRALLVDLRLGPDEGASSFVVR